MPQAGALLKPTELPPTPPTELPPTSYSQRVSWLSFGPCVQYAYSTIHKTTPLLQVMVELFAMHF